ncbi:MAG: hypothetical protein IPG22_06135 [Acidobacteria bacterium]|nr:hypothetical protein [Acidobacteriota bacterium]
MHRSRERIETFRVSSLRHYCERSRPPLSSQALIALARYYRNLPYSQTVRSKFDFIITRLFSRPAENEKRVCLFGRDETLAHINTLYREWSSIALYGANDDTDSNVLLTALSFEDLAIEAENAGNFDQLIAKDFFGRLRAFKESISETFTLQNVLAAAIEANVRIGNAYVTLIEERAKADAESIQNKYGDHHDESVSVGAARTLELMDLLRSPLNPDKLAEEVHDEPHIEAPETLAAAPEPERPKAAKVRSPFFGNLREKAFSINRWLLATSLLLIAASFGLYVYSNFFLTESVAPTGVRTVQFEDSSYAEYITTARVSGETLYGILSPTWETLPKEKRQDLLLKIYQAGKDKGYAQVNLLSKDGKIAAFASSTRLDIVDD